MTRDSECGAIRYAIRYEEPEHGADVAEGQATRASKVDSGQLIGLTSVCLGFFVIQLDVTIVNVALPAVQREIGGSLGGLQWVIDAYTLGLAAVMLTAGSQADRVGARRVFATGLVVFGLGSAACAASPTLGVLIAARAVQGLGASALLPCSLALIVHQFPDRRARARALGVWGGMGSAGVALGPVLGGGLVAVAGWRSIFLVNVPLASGILNAARQSGGALGVALLGALLFSSGGMSGASGQRGSGHAHSMALRAPLAVAAAGYLLAICLTLAIRQDPAQRDGQPHGTRSAR